MQKKKAGIIIAVALTAVIFLIVGYDLLAKNSVYESTGFAMDAVISQKIEAENGEKIAEEIIKKIKSTENNISRTIEDSEISVLNKNKKAEISAETTDYLKELVNICQKTKGSVDLTVGPLVNAWGIGSETFRVPEENELKIILGNVDYKKIIFEEKTVSIGENQTVDLGFAGKGIACDEAKKILEENNAERGIISVGGSLCLYGEGDFSVGIRNPLGNVSDYMAVLNIQESFVSTSGNYERFSEKDGKKYHHILSTETGYPVENNLLSVTIVCQSGILSDVLSTACYCLGYEKSLVLLKEYNAEAVFIFDDNTVKITDGLADKIEIKNNEFRLWKEN